MFSRFEYIIADFKAVFYADSKNHTYFFKSNQIFKIPALTLNV